MAAAHVTKPPLRPWIFAEPAYEAMTWAERIEWHLQQIHEKPPYARLWPNLDRFDAVDAAHGRIGRRLAQCYGHRMSAEP